MPTKRKRAPRNVGFSIPEEAVDAFIAGDWLRLHRALKLPPWHTNPLDVFDGECPWGVGNSGTETWPAAVALRAELISLAQLEIPDD